MTNHPAQSGCHRLCLPLFSKENRCTLRRRMVDEASDTRAGLGSGAEQRRMVRPLQRGTPCDHRHSERDPRLPVLHAGIETQDRRMGNTAGQMRCRLNAIPFHPVTNTTMARAIAPSPWSCVSSICFDLVSDPRSDPRADCRRPARHRALRGNDSPGVSPPCAGRPGSTRHPPRSVRR